jgi:hypothetical protein
MEYTLYQVCGPTFPGKIDIALNNSLKKIKNMITATALASIYSDKTRATRARFRIAFLRGFSILMSFQNFNRAVFLSAPRGSGAVDKLPIFRL